MSTSTYSNNASESYHGSEGSEAASYGEVSEHGSPLANHFDLPPLHARDFAQYSLQPMPTLNQSTASAEQQAGERLDSASITQWSRSIQQ